MGREGWKWRYLSCALCIGYHIDPKVDIDVDVGPRSATFKRLDDVASGANKAKLPQTQHITFLPVTSVISIILPFLCISNRIPRNLPLSLSLPS